MEDGGCNFYHHPSFKDELGEFIERHCAGQQADVATTIEYTERGLYNHLFKRNISFSSKHFGRASGFGAYEVYWLRLFIPNSGISKTQQPKVYLLKHQSTISILCLDSHIQNYKDSKLRNAASIRIQEVAELVQKQ